MTETVVEQWSLRRGSLTYPTPVAIACGRVLRARTAAERVNACLKAAEVLTRYLAAVAVASFASRDDDVEAKLSELSGNLSFGHFLTTVQEITAARGQHPAQHPLRYAFRVSKKEKGSGATNDALSRLLTLRNRLGHELATLDEIRASIVEADDRPLAALVHALIGAEALLAHPLFVVEQQEWVKKDSVFVLRRLLLMGESLDPAPTFAVVQRDSSIENLRVPYVAIGESCVHLPPWILWGIDEQRKNLSLLFLDGVEDDKIIYCTIDGTKQDGAAHLASALRDFFRGEVARPFDTVLLVDGRHLSQEWADIRERIEESGRRQDGTVDWGTFDPATLQWYAQRLDRDAPDSHALIRDRLLDGRHHVEPDELRQLTLLFGRPREVRSRLQRDVLDLRVIDPKSMRPVQDKRDIVESANLIEALKRAVRYFAEHTGMKDVDPEDLNRTEGAIDYLTLREIFVNQTIHQDYTDPTASAQISLWPDKVTVFNTGYSLVPTERLLDGDRSQSRNPLIARALRLIGFAEISGSGIRAVHLACQKARRPAPVFESSRETNTFSLTLSTVEEKVMPDAYWKKIVGISLSEQQAQVLNAIAEAASATIPLIESATGLEADDIIEVIDFLVFQRVVEQDEANFRLAQHLRERLE